jgi:DNA-binding ferritin-like protein
MSNMPFAFTGEEAELKDVIFIYLSKLMSATLQLRMNHWQTTSFAEHKMTDGLIDDLNGLIDTLGELTLGTFERPQFQTVSYNISDSKVANAKFVLESLDKETKTIIDTLSVTAHEDIKNTLAEIQAVINKNKYLSTLS